MLTSLICCVTLCGDLSHFVKGRVGLHGFLSYCSRRDTFSIISFSVLQVKMNRMRQRIAQRLKEAQNTCAMLTTFNEIDMR